MGNRIRVANDGWFSVMYCKICDKRGVETNTHTTAEHQEEPLLWSFVAEIIKWTYTQREVGNIDRDNVIEALKRKFEELSERRQDFLKELERPEDTVKVSLEHLPDSVIRKLIDYVEAWLAKEGMDFDDFEIELVARVKKSET